MQNGFDDFDTTITAEEYYEYYLSEGYTPEMAEELAAQDERAPLDKQHDL